MPTTLTPGAHFPDFTLPDHTKTERRLSQVQGQEDPIRRVWNGYYYWGRPSVAELHAELRDLTRSIRPDWDLSDPALKKRWAAGDKAPFYPYGVKSMERTLLEMAGAVDHYSRSE